MLRSTTRHFLGHFSIQLATLALATTAWAQAPPNDACSGAIPITCGQTVVGSTTEATNDVEAFDCGTSVSAAGIWYSFVGTGDALSLTTCENTFYDTKINVYTGYCNALICVTGNDDGGNCGTGTTASFASDLGTTYYILVQGYEGVVGEFEMIATCGPVTNDYCQGATPIICYQSLSGSTLDATPDAVEGCGTGIQAPGVWYTFTGISDPVVLSTCESTDYDTRINIYSGGCNGSVCVTGNDDTPGIGTCSTVGFLPDAGTTYFVLVQGYDGQVGNFLLELNCQTCATPSDVSSAASDVSATIFWSSLNDGATYVIEYGPLGFEQGTGLLATGTVSGGANIAVIEGLEPDTEYAFYLHEECGESDVSATIGVFTFTTLADPPAVNATCSGALPIGCGVSVDGDTQESYFQPGAACGPSFITTQGLWYSFVGTGETVTLSTCDQAAFDTKISVYSGACGVRTCVAGSDDAIGCGGNTSAIAFPSVLGTEYLVFVHGYQDQQGTFTLSMTCAPTCSPVASNDVCTGALELAVNGIGLCDPIQGSNACAFSEGMPNPPCDPYYPIVDTWYTFTTDGSSTITLFAAALSAGEVSAAVYADCGMLDYIDCETGINGPWQLNNLETNTTHYLRVWNGGGENAGTFAVCIESDLTTGVEEISTFNTVRMWPNPTNDRIHIEGAAAKQLAVIDLQGRIVMTHSMPTDGIITLDVANLAPGSYVVRSLEDSTTLGRFVKE